MGTYKRVFTGSSITVRLLSDLLERKQIDTIIKDNEESARLAGFGSYRENVELLVDEYDLRKATAVIASFQEGV